MPRSSLLRFLANNKPAEALDLIVGALRVSRGDRMRAALVLRASGHLPPRGTTCDRGVVTLYEIIRALPEGSKILTLYPSPSCRVEGVDYVDAPAAEPVPAPPPAAAGDGARTLAARKRAGYSLRGLAHHLGYADKASIQNVEIKGMKLTGALKTWVEQQERLVSGEMRR